MAGFPELAPLHTCMQPRWQPLTSQVFIWRNNRLNQRRDFKNRKDLISQQRPPRFQKSRTHLAAQGYQTVECGWESWLYQSGFSQRGRTTRINTWSDLLQGTGSWGWLGKSEVHRADHSRTGCNSSRLKLLCTHGISSSSGKPQF